MNITRTNSAHPKFSWKIPYWGRVAAATDLGVPNHALYQAKLHPRSFAVTCITDSIHSQHSDPAASPRPRLIPRAVARNPQPDRVQFGRRRNISPPDARN